VRQAAADLPAGAAVLAVLSALREFAGQHESRTPRAPPALLSRFDTKKYNFDIAEL